jgi:hypothetical protein
MSAVARRYQRSAATVCVSAAADMRCILRTFIHALDRLVPPSTFAPRHPDLPEEWFKYPPI